MELVDYFRMKITDLPPREYMATSRYDYELSADVHREWNKGVEDARSMQEK